MDADDVVRGASSGADEDYTPDLVGLEDEDGVTHQFEILDIIEMDGERYAALMPYSTDPAERLAMSDEMYVMHLTEDVDSVYYDLVEDDDELESALQIFRTRLEEMYEIDAEALDDAPESR